MDLFDVAKACARRWWIFLPLIAGSLWFTYQSYSTVAPVYYGSTTIGLVAPSVQAEQDPGVVKKNALAESGSALMINLLSLGLSDGTTRSNVVAQGGDGSYTADVFTIPGGQLPLVVISATTPTPELTSQTVGLVAAQAAEVMRGLQGNAGVPADTFVMPYVVIPAGQPVEGIPSRTKAAITLLGGSVALTVLATVIVDLLLTRRSEQRATRKAEPIPDSDPQLDTNNSEVRRTTADDSDECRVPESSKRA